MAVMSRGPRLSPLPHGAEACLVSFRSHAVCGSCCFSTSGLGLMVEVPMTSKGPRLSPVIYGCPAFAAGYTASTAAALLCSGCWMHHRW
jgi:hypothetical protein